MQSVQAAGDIEPIGTWVGPVAAMPKGDISEELWCSGPDSLPSCREPRWHPGVRMSAGSPRLLQRCVLTNSAAVGWLDVAWLLGCGVLAVEGAAQV